MRKKHKSIDRGSYIVQGVMFGMMVAIAISLVMQVRSLKLIVNQQQEAFMSLFSVESQKTAFVLQYKSKILELQPKLTEFDATILLSEIFDYTERFGLAEERDLVLSLVHHESSFYREATSPVGARGWFQLMPATALIAADALGKDDADWNIIDDNVELGIYWFAQLRKNYNPQRAVACYNAGERNYKISMGYGDKVVAKAAVWQ